MWKYLLCSPLSMLRAQCSTSILSLPSYTAMPYSSTQLSKDHFHQYHKTLLPVLASPIPTSALYNMVPWFCYSSFRQVFIKHLTWSVGQQFSETNWTGLSLHPSTVLQANKCIQSSLWWYFFQRPRRDFQPYFSLVMGQKLGLGVLRKNVNMLISLLAISVCQLLYKILNYWKKYLSLQFN